MTSTCADLIAGVGKSSLIKSIVQTCEDIVHVDPLSPSLPSVDRLPGRRSKNRGNSAATSTHSITEVFASTKAYPPWWSDIEDTIVLHRRQSLGDTVLERNICFVDTPGYSQGMSRVEGIESVTQYVETQLYKSLSSRFSKSESVGLLSGSGGSQVDLVLYLVAQSTYIISILKTRAHIMQKLSMKILCSCKD